MIDLKFHNLRDKVPDVNIPINYFVIKNPLIMIAGGFRPGSEMYKGECSFDWTGYCNENGYDAGVSCCYDYDSEEENNLPIGHKDEHGEITYVKEMYLTDDNGPNSLILPFRSDESEENDIEIAWEYSHVVYYNLSKQVGFNKQEFPSHHLEMLMNDGLIEMVRVESLRAIYYEDDNIYVNHLTAVFDWQGIMWRIKGAQNDSWTEGAWEDGKYYDISIFSAEIINE